MLIWPIKKRTPMTKFTLLFTAALLSVMSFQTFAGELEQRQAKRIHDRLTGVPPTNAVLTTMENLLLNDPTGKTAADEAIKNKAFYNITLKNFATPWTNEEQTIFAPLNDYSATVIGLVRDDEDFRKLLYDNIVYTGNNSLSSAYSNSNNNHYVELENLGYENGNLADPNILVQKTQTEVTGLEASATAGLFTTRQGARSYYYLGTNRAMLRFALINHLCTDFEPLSDITRIPDRIRQDVSRSPGGDSRLFLNGCLGCHAGMDGLAGGLSRYDLTFTEDSDGNVIENTAQLNYAANGVQGKYLINSNNFSPGYVTTDDSWINYWRNGKNSRLGWGNNSIALPAPNNITIDDKGHAMGTGAKSLGIELASSTAFASCQVKKVFKSVCFRDPDDKATDRAQVTSSTNNFINSGYKLKSVFAETAAFCKGS